MSKSEVFKKKLMLVALMCAVLLAVSALFFGGGTLSSYATGEHTETEETGGKTTPEYELKTFTNVTGKEIASTGTSYIWGSETEYAMEWENGGAELPSTGWSYAELDILRVTVRASQNADKVKGFNVAICDIYSTDRGYNWSVADVSLNTDGETTVDLQISDDNKFGTLDMAVKPRRIKFAVIGDEAAADDAKITIDVKVEVCKEVKEVIVPATEDHVFVASKTGSITGGKTEASQAIQIGDSTAALSENVLMAYEGARITVEGDKASIITGLRLKFVSNDNPQVELWYTPSVMFTDGKNVHYVSVNDMGWNQSPNAAAMQNKYNPNWVEFAVLTGGTENDACEVTVKIEFITEMPENPNDPELKNLADYQLWTRTKEDLVGGNTNWQWIDGGIHNPSGYYMRRYQAVEITIAGTKASMINSILFTTTMGKQEWGYEKNVSLEDGTNTLIYEMQDILKTVPAGVDANKWKAETCRLLVKTANGWVLDVCDITVTVKFYVIMPELPPAPAPKPHVMANMKRVIFNAYANPFDIVNGFAVNYGGTAAPKTTEDYTHARISLVCRENADKITKLQLDLGKGGDIIRKDINIADLSGVDFSNGKGVDIDMVLSDMASVSGTNKKFAPETIWLRAFGTNGATGEVSVDARVYLYHENTPAPDTADLNEDNKPDEPALKDIVDHTFTTVTRADFKGGNAQGLVVQDAQVTKSAYLFKRYDGVKITVSGTSASLLNGIAIVLSDADNNRLTLAKTALTNADGEATSTLFKRNVFANSLEYDEFYFFAESLVLVLYSGGSATDTTDLTVKVELIILPELTGDVHLFDFWYKGGVENDEYHYDKENDKYIEDRGAVIAEYTKNGGKDGESGACTITAVDCSAANGQVWVTTGGRIVDQKPVDVKEDDKLMFENFGSIDLFMYVKEPQWVENILITLGTKDNTGSGEKLMKAIGIVEQSGWQHIRFNLDSMTTMGGFDWETEEKHKMVSIEFVVTVRQGTPDGTKIIIDDLWLRAERCDPKIEMNEEFELTGTTGEKIDLKDSVTATHPFDEPISQSFGVQFSKTEDGAKSPVTVSGTEFTPYKNGYYFITAIASDAMGASAQAAFVIRVTGDDIDSEPPSISFGSLPQYMPQPGEINLSVIKVTDDIDTDIVPTITVKDADGNELAVADGKVTFTKPGEYTVTVSATDKAGHNKTVTRKITVAGEATTEPEPTEDSKKKGCGCGSDLTATSALLAALLLTVAGVVLLRRRKENN